MMSIHDLISSTKRTKRCSNCKTHLPLSHFGKNKSRKDGLHPECKSCSKKRAQLYCQTPAGIYNTLMGSTRFRNKKPINITREEFVQWYTTQSRICGYCDLTEEDLWILQKQYGNRVKRLTIDSMDNLRGYDVDNLILACIRCNFIKSDLLSYNEMREFAQKYLKPNWLKIKKDSGA